LQELLVPSKVKVLGAQAARIDDEHKCAHTWQEISFAMSSALRGNFRANFFNGKSNVQTKSSVCV
jgi:hypothetical protein